MKMEMQVSQQYIDSRKKNAGLNIPLEIYKESGNGRKYWEEKGAQNAVVLRTVMR